VSDSISEGAGECCSSCGALPCHWTDPPVAERSCTCHPDDRPAGDCPRRFAATDCRDASERASTFRTIATLAALARKGEKHPLLEAIEATALAATVPERQSPRTCLPQIPRETYSMIPNRVWSLSRHSRAEPRRRLRPSDECHG
jgi:hypothetical protein